MAVRQQVARKSKVRASWPSWYASNRAAPGRAQAGSGSSWSRDIAPVQWSSNSTLVGEDGDGRRRVSGRESEKEEGDEWGEIFLCFVVFFLQ